MKTVIFKKELRENLIAFKGIVWLFIITLLLSAMAYSFVGVKEMSLLAQTEMMVTFGKLVLGLGLLMSIILSSISFSSEREQSTLESLLLTPIAKVQMALGKLGAILMMWFFTFLLAIPYFVVLSAGTLTLRPMLLFLFVMGTVVTFLFACISMALSILMGSSKGAMMTSIIVFLISVVPMFLSSTMTKAGLGALLDKVSPVSNALNLMKEMVLTQSSTTHWLPFIFPVIIVGILAYVFLLYGVRRLGFEGGE